MINSATTICVMRIMNTGASLPAKATSGRPPAQASQVRKRRRLNSLPTA